MSTALRHTFDVEASSITTEKICGLFP